MKPTYRVLLIGNYRLDHQMSMLGYHDLLLRELAARGVNISSIEPAAWFGRFSAGSLTKWLRYIDKYFVFPFVLRGCLHRELASLQKNEQLVVHITDHSNAPYLRFIHPAATVITCHDLLAVRGALGEDTDCPASGFGKILQSSILNGLRQMDHVLCVSEATATDLRRLAPGVPAAVIALPLNRPFSILPPSEARAKIGGYRSDLLDCPYVLHVGSSLRRKNREGVLRAFAQSSDRWNGKLVFAGEALPPELLALSIELGIQHRIIELLSPPGPILEALYNCAHCLFFPSRAEGFGWPIIEAQACGCPVLTARTTSLPEVAGLGALIRDFDDKAGFAEDILRLQDPLLRSELIAKGAENLRRFQMDRIMDQYLDFYANVVQPARSDADRNRSADS